MDQRNTSVKISYLRNTFTEDVLMIIPLIIANMVVFNLPYLRIGAGYAYMVLVITYTADVFFGKYIKKTSYSLFKYVLFIIRSTRPQRVLFTGVIFLLIFTMLMHTTTNLHMVTDTYERSG